eukprot:CAMPEP_0171103600 /NCGR_PEP_ID=MMETSP0766_2-20121228/59007_1 /TAXON_ID=439317 /ORGANISM="Gambierdiscus australes, Strain CAWD 149" /LENGTH=60 /DNA_ID=CAMNT_0011564041 /DNA_START=219 /DNA_END=397 /DNA_ORIENTATION=-
MERPGWSLVPCTHLSKPPTFGLPVLLSIPANLAGPRGLYTSLGVPFGRELLRNSVSGSSA